MELLIQPVVKENSIEQLKKLSRETGIGFEIISSIPVFTIEKNKKETISKVAKFYGGKAVFRVINANFISDAIEFGTDKGRVEKHDFRRVADGCGYDVWGVEKKAIEIGLSKSDVFCGTPYKFFVRGEDEFCSAGLGIPEDRSAILIFDGKKLKEIKDTDGYVFNDPKNKRNALLGIIKYKENPIEFEKELNSIELIDKKIEFIEKQVFENLNNMDDLDKAQYIAFNIILLLHNESKENMKNTSRSSIHRINKLKNLAERLEYEKRMIHVTDNMEKQIKMTRDAFETGNYRKMELMRSWPDFVIKTTNEYLVELELDEKYTQRLLKVIEEAKKCKIEIGLEKQEKADNLHKSVRDNIKRTLVQ